MSPREAAVRDALALFKLSGEDVALVAKGKTPFRPLDPALEAQRRRDDVGRAFDTNATLDRETPSTMPEPGVLHRLEG